MKEELTRTELRRIAEEFKTERDAAKRDTLRAFDERNILLNENMALTEKCEKLGKALREAERGFELAYNAAEKGLIDEVLLHCGAHVAKISTALFQTAIKRRKHNEI